MNEGTDYQALFTDWFLASWQWVRGTFLEPERLVELAIILVAFLLSSFVSGWFRRGLQRAFAHLPMMKRVRDRLVYPLLTATITLVLVWTAQLLITPVMGQAYLLGVATNLIGAWIVIRIALSMMTNREFARMIAVVAWSIAALNIMGLLDPITQVMEDAQLPIGETHISVLDIVTGLLAFGLLIWLASFLSSLIDRQLKNITTMPPSVRVLVGKSAKILLFAIAFLAALNASGVDLTALAVFGGALGVGIGFGLQKVVGNFISGIILLVDRSIKPGDVIETGGTYGRINKLAARYTSVITRDGTEFLIPNEDMITQPVINWSHTDKLVRRRIPVQISYQSDLKLAMELMVKAASDAPRVLKTPAPRTLLRGFGESGVDLELRMWLNDPGEGVSNIASEVMMTIWDEFHANGIEFPYPHRVVKIENDGGAKILGD